MAQKKFLDLAGLSLFKTLFKDYVDQRIKSIVNNAPAELDTLKEIADYLNSDSVAGGLIQQLANKVNKSGDIMTGNLTVPTINVGNSVLSAASAHLKAESIRLENSSTSTAFLLTDAAVCETFRGTSLLDFSTIITYNSEISVLAKDTIGFAVSSGGTTYQSLVITKDGLVGNLLGNAATASKLKTPFTLTIGSVSKKIDGSSDVQFPISVSNNITLDTITANTVTSKYYLLSDSSWQLLDLTGKNQNTWYPVSFRKLGASRNRFSLEIACDLDSLNVKSTASWCGHQNGFCVYFSETINISNWGASTFSRIIHDHSFSWVSDNKDPIGRVYNTSSDCTEIIWLRGGVKYRYRVSDPTNLTVSVNSSYYQNALVSTDKHYPTTNPPGLETTFNTSGSSFGLLKDVSHTFGGIHEVVSLKAHYGVEAHSQNDNLPSLKVSSSYGSFNVLVTNAGLQVKDNSDPNKLTISFNKEVFSLGNVFIYSGKNNGLSLQNPYSKIALGESYSLEYYQGIKNPIFNNGQGVLSAQRILRAEVQFKIVVSTMTFSSEVIFLGDKNLSLNLQVVTSNFRLSDSAVYYRMVRTENIQGRVYKTINFAFTKNTWNKYFNCAYVICYFYEGSSLCEIIERDGLVDLTFRFVDSTPSNGINMRLLFWN